MPLNTVKIALAVQGGVSTVCATCDRYWEGRERGLPEPKCTSVRGCGSPLAGRAFEDYRGPMTQFDRWCFVCGSASKYGIRVGGAARVFGMCAEHIGLMEQLQAVGLNGIPAREVIAARKADMESFLTVPKKTLLQAVAETDAKLDAEAAEIETHYAEKHGTPGQSPKG